MNKNLWNFLQLGRGILQLRPMDCHYPNSPVLCPGCEPGHVFDCPQCERLRSWCNGASDSEICDECWAKAEKWGGWDGQKAE